MVTISIINNRGKHELLSYRAISGDCVQVSKRLGEEIESLSIEQAKCEIRTLEKYGGIKNGQLNL